VRLLQGLDDVDKQRVTYVSRFQPKLVSGRFPRTNARRLVPGIESVRRAFIGPGTPAQKPSLSPIVESLCMELVHKYRRSTTVHTAKGRLCVPKWTKVIDGYTHLKYWSTPARLYRRRPRCNCSASTCTPCVSGEKSAFQSC